MLYMCVYSNSICMHSVSGKVESATVGATANVQADGYKCQLAYPV